MNEERIHNMLFSSVYPLYVQKAVRKGRSPEEVDEIICWLTGFDQTQLQEQIEKKNNFRAFFDQARLHENASKITGVICGYRVEDIADPVVQKVRYLDKLIDELAKGRPMEKILRP